MMNKFLIVLLLVGIVLCENVKVDDNNVTSNTILLSVGTLLTIVITLMLIAISLQAYLNFGKYRHVIPVLALIFFPIYSCCYIFGIYKIFDDDSATVYVIVNLLAFMSCILTCLITAVIGSFIPPKETFDYDDAVEFDL